MRRTVEVPGDIAGEVARLIGGGGIGENWR